MAESVGECLEEDGVSQELELLKNVYLEDLQVLSQDRSRMELLFHVTPSTGEHVHSKYVYIDLHFMLTQQYPVHPVEITIPASRGISDTHLKEILTALTLRATTLTGGPMMYELVDYAKDSLTNNNVPCDDCIVCLQPFHDGDSVARTDCYHYFHTKCLTRYYKFYKRQQQQEDTVPIVDPSHQTKPKSLECPVCRDHIPSDATCLEAVSHLTTQQSLEEEEEEIYIPQKVRRWQQQMAKLQQQQQEKGGLIDVRAKDDVINATWVRPVSSDQKQHKPHKETQYGEVLIGHKQKVCGGGCKQEVGGGEGGCKQEVGGGEGGCKQGVEGCKQGVGGGEGGCKQGVGGGEGGCKQRVDGGERKYKKGQRRGKQVGLRESSSRGRGGGGGGGGNYQRKSQNNLSSSNS